MPQSPVVVSGPKEEIDATEWWSKTVTHCITGSGFTLRIAFKKKNQPGDTERERDHDPEEGITGVKAEWRTKPKRRTTRALSWLARSTI
jgi:hypothetical protein